MQVWRISNYADLTAIGGKYKAGRWNKLGRKIVYCAEHPALAMIEILVHTDPADLPESYRLLGIDIKEDSMISDSGLDHGSLPDDETCRGLFEAFCEDAVAPVMRVPSGLIPHAFNLLINPEHPSAGAITITSDERLAFDPRFRT